MTLAVGAIGLKLLSSLVTAVQTNVFKLALQHLKQDFPEANVTAKKRYKNGIKHLVDFELADGRTLTYSVNRQDEVARLVS